MAWSSSDLIIFPFSGFLMGLFIVWLLGAWLQFVSKRDDWLWRGFPFSKRADYTGVRKMLYWTSSAIALYYLVLAAFAIYRDYDSLIGELLGLAVACWLIGWLIQRNEAPR